MELKLLVNPYNVDKFVNPETNDYIKREFKIFGKIMFGVDVLVLFITIVAIIVRLN